MGGPAEEVIPDKFRSPPPQRQAEAEHFLDFLRESEARAQAADRLAQAFKRLDAVAMPPMSPEDVQSESTRHGPSDTRVMRIVADTNTMVSGPRRCWGDIAGVGCVGYR